MGSHHSLSFAFVDEFRSAHRSGSDQISFPHLEFQQGRHISPGAQSYRVSYSISLLFTFCDGFGDNDDDKEEEKDQAAY